MCKATKKILSIVLSLLLMSSLSGTGMASSVEKEERYNTAILQLESWLEQTGQPVSGLEQVYDVFESLGGYEMSRAFGYYTRVLAKCVNKEFDYDYTFWTQMLESNTVFQEYLKNTVKSPSIGTVDDLLNYAHGIQAEQEGDIGKAGSFYLLCLNYYDASIRYEKIAGESSRSFYEQGRALMQEGKFEEAIEAFENARGYGDSLDRIAFLKELAGGDAGKAKENPVSDAISITSWNELQKAVSNPQGSLCLQLDADLRAEPYDTTIVIPEEAEVTINLNGHTIDRACGDAREDGSVIYIEVDASLTIFDELKTGRITGGNTTSNGGGIWTKGDLKIRDISIEGNSSGEGGGAICVDYDATLEISDSIMRNNKTADCGGAIYNHGTMTVSNCTVTGNACDGAGAGIWTDGTATIEGTEIHDNENAINGGGLTNHGVTTVTGGTIRKNTVSGAGGGVFHGNNGEKNKTAVLTIIDTTIRDNSARQFGGGIYIGNGNVNLQGSTSVTGNTTQDGGAAGVFMTTGTLSVQDSLKVQDNYHGQNENDIYLYDNQSVTISGPLNTDAHIGVYLKNVKGAFTKGFSKHNSMEAGSVFFSNTGKEIIMINGEAASR